MSDTNNSTSCTHVVEHERRLAELAETIRIERESKLQICETEINMYMDLKKREMHLWESKERALVQQQIQEYETTQRQQQQTALETEIEELKTRTRTLFEKELKQHCDQKKQELEREMSTLRADEFRKIRSEIDSLYKSQSEKIRNELLHFENKERTEVERSSRARTEKVKSDLAEFEQTMKASISDRIAIYEECEMKRLVAERDAVLTKKMEELQQIREEEQLQKYKRKEIELETAHLNRIAALEISLKAVEADKLASALLEIETKKLKLSQDLDTQYQRDVLLFRTKMADEYTKTQTTLREKNEKEIQDIKERHRLDLARLQSEFENTLEEENNGKIQAFKTKLNDEFTRLRLVEKMLLQSEIESEANRIRERLAPEYNLLKKRAEDELVTFKHQLSENLLEERLQMESDSIKAHLIAAANHKKTLEAEMLLEKERLERDLSAEMKLRRTELLELLHDELAAYKQSKTKDIEHDVSTIRERELEEMRESLYVLAMERVKEKISSVRV